MAKKKNEPVFAPDYFEPEHTEPVEHDTIMILVDGELREVEVDDPQAE